MSARPSRSRSPKKPPPNHGSDIPYNPAILFPPDAPFPPMPPLPPLPPSLQNGSLHQLNPAVSSEQSAVDDNDRPAKFDPLAFEKETRGLMIACAPLLPDNPDTVRPNRVAFSLHPDCVKYVSAQQFALLKSLRVDTHVSYYLHTDEGKPKVLELWGQKRRSVSTSSNRIAEYLIKCAKEEVARIREKQAGGNREDRYAVTLSLQTSANHIGPIIGFRGDVQRALASKSGLHKISIKDEDDKGNRQVKLSGMPFSVAYARCLIQERLRYKGEEIEMDTGSVNAPLNDLDEELLYTAYKAVWTEYFSQKALCDYATTLSNFVAKKTTEDVKEANKITFGDGANIEGLDCVAG